MRTLEDYAEVAERAQNDPMFFDEYLELKDTVWRLYAALFAAGIIIGLLVFDKLNPLI